MSRFSTASLLALLLWLAPTRVAAFALMGPYATWQVFEIGYNLPGDGADRGVMNINEGYRQTIPIMTYGFDATFLKYFGTNGVNAVEQAIQMFNDLPAADAMTADLSEFPLKALRINSTASAAGLIDVKTVVASHLLKQLGLNSAERFVWTIRSRFAPTPPPASYSVIQRNWDPITRNPSSFVNGELFTYTILQTYANADAWEAVEIPVDSAADGLTTVVSYLGLGGGTILGNGIFLYGAPGGFFGSFTRDDAGGLRHLYESRNYAVEPLAADVFSGGGGGGSVSSGSGEAPWLPVTTFTVVTNGTTTVTNGTAPRVVTALRPGIGKITFKRVDYDSLLTSTRQPYQVTWTDRYVTNGITRAQQVSRLITVPDVIFRAVDLGVGPPSPGLTAFTSASENESALNTTGGVGEVDGPGVLRTPLEIDFGNAGRFLLNFTTTGQGSGETDATLGLSFGSFDGSTNQPVPYPDGLSVKALEDMVLNGR